MNKMKIKIVAGILVVFFLGTIIGALGTGIFVMHRIRRFTEEGTTLGRHWFMKRLSRRLALTEAQKPEVERILEQTEEEILEFLRDSHSEFAQIMQRQNAELKRILNPEQQKKLDEMYERFQKHGPPGLFRGEKH